MKKWFLRLLLCAFFLVSGWGFGYIRFPYIDSSQSFVIGFATCLGLSLSIYLWVKLRQSKNSSIYRSRKSVSGFKFTAIVLVIVGCFLLTSSYLFLSKKKLSGQLEKNKQTIALQDNQIKTLEQHKLSILLGNLLSDVRGELNQNQGIELSSSTIDNIVDLSQLFEPYYVATNDSDLSLSPERGQLLLSLAKMNIGDESFSKIKKNANFTYADLRKVNLSNVDLSSAVLSHASFEEAELTNSIFIGARLDRACFTKANARNSNFSGAELEHAILSWANLSNSVLDSSILNSANLTNSDLSKANVERCVFNETLLDSTYVVDNWFFTLDSLKNVGLENVTEKYIEQKDSIEGSSFSYRLIAK